MYEIETKVLDIDKDKVIKRLISIGAEKTQETRLTVDWFRLKGVKEGQDPWFLRMRSNSQGKHEVTWKDKSEILGVARKHREINFLIEEPEKLLSLFEEIGLEKYAHQEKDRISFSFKDCKFDIDTYPLTPPYLEIESDSEENIKEAIKLLGLEDNKTWEKGERTLIQEIYGLNWYNMNFSNE